MAYEKDPNELGCLWAKTSARGEYFTGSIEIDGVKHAIVVFKNTSKRSDKAPDWRILKSQPRQGGEPKTTDAVDQINDESIPF